MKRFVLLLILSGLAFAQTHSNTLTWGLPTTGDPPTGYHVWKATGASFTAACASLPAPGSAVPTGTAYATVAAPSLTYVDTAVVAGQNSCYEVSAFNTGGESVLSNNTGGTTPYFPPGVPVSLSSVAK